MCAGVRRWIWLFKCGVIIGHRLQQKHNLCHNFYSAWQLNSIKVLCPEKTLLTSVSLCLLARSSCVGECGLLAGAPLTESSRPLGSSLGLLVALGCASPLSTVLTELLAGGEGGLALTEVSSEWDGWEEIRLEWFIYLRTCFQNVQYCKILVSPHYVYIWWLANGTVNYAIWLYMQLLKYYILWKSLFKLNR